MELSVKVNDNQMCKVYFSLSANEVQNLYDEMKLKFATTDNPLINLFIEEAIYKYIDEDILDVALLKKDIIPVACKEIKYLSPLNKNRPLIGIAYFPKLLDPIRMNLPEYIEYDDEEFIERYAKNKFMEKLRETGLYYLKEVDKANINSVIKYDLNYSQDGKVLSSIENQEFDLEFDSDLDKDLFVGAKSGDIVIIDDEQITSEAVVKKIYDKVEYTSDSYEKNKLKVLGYDDFEFFETSFCEAAESEIYEIKIINKLSSYILKNNNFDFSDDLIAFYLKRNNNDLDTAKKRIVLDYLLKIIEIQEDYEIVSEDDLSILFSEIEILDLGTMSDEAHRNVVINRINNLKILNVLRDKGIISF